MENMYVCSYCIKIVNKCLPQLPSQFQDEPCFVQSSILVGSVVFVHFMSNVLHGTGVDFKGWIVWIHWVKVC